MVRPRTRLSSALIAATCAATLYIAPARVIAAPLPERPTPSGFTSSDDPGGGRIVAGPLSGGTSPETAFRAGMHQMRAYFDGPPTILNAVRTRDGGVTTALFRATLRHAPVTGLAITAVVPHGPSRIALVFDDADRFCRTLAPLMAHLQNMPIASTAGGLAVTAGVTTRPVPPLHEIPFNDGTGSISLPADWTPKSLGQGAAVAEGPGSMRIAIGAGVPINDPNGPLIQQEERMGMHPPGLIVPYTRDLIRAFVSVDNALAAQRGEPDPQVHILHAKLLPSGNQATIEGTHIVAGVLMHFSTLETVIAPGPSGGWLMSVSAVAAPDSEFAQDKPILMAVAHSYRYNNDAMMHQVNAWIADNAAEMRQIMDKRQQAGLDSITRTGQTSIANARAAQDSIDRSAAGMIHYINGTDVVQYLPSGDHGTTGADLAQSLAKQDPEHFRVVPVNEYRKGVDY